MTAEEDEVVEAAKAADIHHRILSFTDGKAFKKMLIRFLKNKANIQISNLIQSPQSRYQHFRKMEFHLKYPISQK